MHILVTNDDGIASPALAQLRRHLEPYGRVTVIAPDRNQSATSQSLTLHRPLRIHPLGEDTYSVDGTPTDCVLVAFHGHLVDRPDFVVSGINHGPNMGEDVFYSGTVAAAREGAMRGMPALAVSAHARTPADYEKTADLGRRFAEKLLEMPRGKSALLLNVNVPLKWNGEVRAARLGARNYEEVLDQRTDPRGREYLWLGGSGVRHEPDPGSDTDAHDAGFASVTPLILDLTAQAELPLVEHLVKSL